MTYAFRAALAALVLLAFPATADPAPGIAHLADTSRAERPLTLSVWYPLAAEPNFSDSPCVSLVAQCCSTVGCTRGSRVSDFKALQAAFHRLHRGYLKTDEISAALILSSVVEYPGGEALQGPRGAEPPSPSPLDPGLG